MTSIYDFGGSLRKHNANLTRTTQAGQEHTESVSLRSDEWLRCTGLNGSLYVERVAGFSGIRILPVYMGNPRGNAPRTIP